MCPPTYRSSAAPGLNVVKTEFINKANTTLPGDISEPSAETSEEPVFHSVIVNRSLDQGPV